MKKTLLRQDAEDIRSSAYETIREQIENGAFIIEIGAYFKVVTNNKAIKLAKENKRFEPHTPQSIAERYGHPDTDDNVTLSGRDPADETYDEPVAQLETEYGNKTHGMNRNFEAIREHTPGEKTASGSLKSLNWLKGELTPRQVYVLEKYSKVSLQKEEFDRSWRQIRNALRKRGTQNMNEQMLKKNDQYYRDALGLLESISDALQKRKCRAFAGDNYPHHNNGTNMSLCLLDEIIQAGLKMNEIYIEYIHFFTTWSNGGLSSYPPHTHPTDRITDKIEQNNIFLLDCISRLRHRLDKDFIIEIDLKKRERIKARLGRLMQSEKDLKKLPDSVKMPATIIHSDSREIRLDWWFFDALNKDGVYYGTINAANTQYKKAINRSKTVLNLPKVNKK